MQTKEIRNPYDHNRLICTVDEKKRITEFYAKGWITSVEFKDDGTVAVTHQKAKPALR